MRRALLTAAVTAVVLLLAAPTSADPDRSLVLSDSTRTASWESALGVGTYIGSPAAFERTRCAQQGGAVVTCDQTLIQLRTPGDLSVDVATQLPRDVYNHVVALHRSDSAGAEGTRSDLRPDRTGPGSRYRAAGLAPGYYLLTVSWNEGVGTYRGTASLRPRKR